MRIFDTFDLKSVFLANFNDLKTTQFLSIFQLKVDTLLPKNLFSNDYIHKIVY